MQKKHRIFIAINLPKEVKRALHGYTEKLNNLPVKWTPQDNLHITLVFLGDLTDEELGEVCMAAKEVAARQESFEIDLTRIGYGPDEKLPPRMLWASGEKSKELSVLKNDLQNTFLERIDFKPDAKIFAPHITLAKINAMEWRQIEPEERPEVGEDINLKFSVESIDVMESEMKRSGPEYVIIESNQLQ